LLCFVNIGWGVQQGFAGDAVTAPARFSLRRFIYTLLMAGNFKEI
jgi:hypothetical protein